MTRPARIDDRLMARRVAGEFRSGEVVVVGSGLPTLVPGQLPPESGVLFLSEGGALGYTTPEGPAQEFQLGLYVLLLAHDRSGRYCMKSRKTIALSISSPVSWSSRSNCPF